MGIERISTEGKVVAVQVRDKTEVKFFARERVAGERRRFKTSIGESTVPDRERERASRQFGATVGLSHHQSIDSEG